MDSHTYDKHSIDGTLNTGMCVSWKRFNFVTSASFKGLNLVWAKRSFTTEIVSHLLAPSSVEDSMNMMWGNRNILSKAGGIVGKHVLNDDARKLLEFDVRICEGSPR